MASANASAFQGELATTWSLLRAAETHSQIKKQLLALDLIIHRASLGRLKTTPMHSCLRRCSTEVWMMIKKQIYTFGLADVTEEWRQDYIRFAASDKWYAKQRVKILNRKVVSPEIMTSRDWQAWSYLEEYYYDSGEWEYNNNIIHSPYNLQRDGHKLITPFLATLGLRLVAKYSSDRTSITYGQHYIGGLTDLFSPICAVDRSLDLTSNAVDEESSVETKTMNVHPSMFSILPPTMVPYDILFRNYQVEFIPMPIKKSTAE